MPPGDKPLRKRLPVMLVVAGALVVVLPVLARALGVGLSLGVVLVYLSVVLAGYAIFLVGMPFFFWIIGEACYRTFIKPYYRAWHIHRIRNRRLWDEVVTRDDSDSA